MDPITLATTAGAALVAAMATDGWQQARGATVGLWRRFRPERAELVAEDLDELRSDALAAQEAQDTATIEQLAADWQQRLAELLRRRPDLAEDLQAVLDGVLDRSLTDDDRVRVQRQINIARDNGRAFGVMNGNLIYHEGAKPADGASRTTP
ncbi:hypothetical protein ACIPRL_37045 [Streptomyces sp. NPDC090085]|uniref:hypothetical protein n=1 Tax=Streptomyces sp. NPDC090085 TaxID=3365943 RepID=UPI003827F1C0